MLTEEADPVGGITPPNGPFFFLVTSNGNSGSKWLARVLSLHEEIICSHSPAHLPLAIQLQREYSSEDYRSIRLAEHRKQLPVDLIFDELVGVGEARYYGNVHFFNLRQLHENLRKFEHEKSFRTVDLVRHPVALVNSGAHNMARQAAVDPGRAQYLRGVQERNGDHYASWRRRYDLDLSDIAVLAFLASTMVLKSLKINIGLQVGRRVKMEVVTSATDALEDLVRYVCPRIAHVNDSYLRKAVTSGKINTHSPSRVPNSPEEIFHGWEPWQQAVFSQLVEETGIALEYGRLGYSLSFITSR